MHGIHRQPIGPCSQRTAPIYLATTARRLQLVQSERGEPHKEAQVRQADARGAAQVRHQPPRRRHQHIRRAAAAAGPWPQPCPGCLARVPGAATTSAEQRGRGSCTGPCHMPCPWQPCHERGSLRGDRRGSGGQADAQPDGRRQGLENPEDLRRQVACRQHDERAQARNQAPARKESDIVCTSNAPISGTAVSACRLI